ncbi:MAG TPA: tetratricopeptide repeat protein [Syntrophobacter fumaroxidans]|nr:tetratricopeptide repeat protein [Syntrophobacter fumaroxidans]
MMRTRRHGRAEVLLVCLFLAISTAGVYWQVKDHEFITFDDNEYVTANPQVLRGLTSDGVKWAFTSRDAGNWHPVTWLSHMLDVRMFGLNAGAHHLMNVLFHIANALLLFLVLHRMTHALWRSAFVAALFALHPLHVESVAWASERKDVLSTFFWMLTMGAYVLYAEKPGVVRYLTALFSFALGLLAKPMLVTLPFVLLLLDYWPLNRLRRQAASLKPVTPEAPWDDTAEAKKTGAPGRAAVRRLLVEKLPFLALSALSIGVTLYAQQRALTDVPVADRLGNAVISTMKYIALMVAPTDLAIFYPHRGMPPWWLLVPAAGLLLEITLLIAWKGHRAPYSRTGWFWYLGTLVPVIGLVQVGAQAMADRYTYVPLIGLFILVAWGVEDFTRAWRKRTVLLAAVSALTLGFLTFLSFNQISHWRTGIELFTHCANVTENNSWAYLQLGIALDDAGRPEAAIESYRAALAISPNHAVTHYNLGLVLARRGQVEEAERHYREAVRLQPRASNFRNNLGLVFARQGKTEEAEAEYREALAIRPDYANAHNNLGVLLAQKGRTEEAIAHYREALAARPGYSSAHNNWGYCLMMADRVEEAIPHFIAALRLKPDDANIHANLGTAFVKHRNPDRAVMHFEEAIRLAPNNINVRATLGKLLAVQGKRDLASIQFKEILRLDPDNEEATRALTVLSR